MQTEALRGKGRKKNFSDRWDNSSNLMCVWLKSYESLRQKIYTK